MKRCVECRSGKCQNCDGIVDLDEYDRPIPCLCDSGKDHPLRIEEFYEFDEDDVDEDDDEHDSKWEH